MQLFKMTNKVNHHHTNQNYKCLLVNLLPLAEFHYKIVVDGKKARLVKADLIPTYDWMMQLVQHMINWKPEFKQMLYSAVVMGDFERNDWR